MLVEKREFPFSSSFLFSQRVTKLMSMYIVSDRKKKTNVYDKKLRFLKKLTLIRFDFVVFKR